MTTNHQHRPRITCLELLDRGDLAVRNRDAAAMAGVARQLASRVGDPLGDRCEALALSCEDQRSRSRAWTRLREAIVDRVATAGS